MARRKLRFDAGSSRRVASRSEALESAVGLLEPRGDASSEPHCLERQIQLELQSKHSFSSLVVRRVSDGICLQGVMDVDDDGPDFDSLAREIAGVARVINQVVIVKRPVAL